MLLGPEVRKQLEIMHKWYSFTSYHAGIHEKACKGKEDDVSKVSSIV